MRYLPITDIDGNFRDNACTWAFCYLAFPESEQDAIRAAECLVSEIEAIECGEQADLSEVGALVSRHVSKRMRNARKCGLVLYQMLKNNEELGGLNLRKALFTISEWFSTAKTVDGRGMASDARNLRKVFKDFVNALPYWAAFELLPIEKQKVVFSDLNVFHDLLVASAKIEMECEKVDVKQKIQGWNPWKVPKKYSDMISQNEIEVILPSQPVTIRDIVESYRWHPNGEGE